MLSFLRSAKARNTEDALRVRWRLCVVAYSKQQLVQTRTNFVQTSTFTLFIAFKILLHCLSRRFQRVLQSRIERIIFDNVVMIPKYCVVGSRLFVQAFPG